MNALKLFPKLVIAVGIAFALAGAIAAGAGIYIRSFVGQQLAAQNIVTPEDASIPNAPVTGIATALSMADIIQHHAADSSNGLSYAQMGRFIAKDDPANPAGTSDEEAALLDEAGKPVSNSYRNQWVTETALSTALNMSLMAEQLSLFGMVVGVALLLTGVGLVILAFAVFGREPAAAATTARAPRATVTG